ncbi:MAG: hypothetical protein OEM51_01760 [Gammaproteobacteria bacterium]|nr:hypothetical protein [Gammaproteobacteria bacterium]
MFDTLTVPKGKIPILDDITGKAREYRIQPATSKQVSSYWDGGSKDSYCAFDACGHHVQMPAHSGAPEFGGNSADVQIDGKPIAYLVNFSIFRGKHMPPTVYLPVAEFERHKADLAADLPVLTDMQLHALAVTAQLKSGFRLNEWTRKYSAEEWDATRAQLREMKLLRKNNAITPAGRNAARETRI